MVHSVTKSLRKSEVSVFTISCRWVCSAHNSPSTCQHRGLPNPQVVEAQVEAEAVLKRTLEQLIDQRGGESALWHASRFCYCTCRNSGTGISYGVCLTKTSRSRAFPVGRRCNAVAPRVSHGPCQHRRRSVVKIRCRKLARLASTSILHLWTDPTSEQSIRGGMRCSNAWSSLCWSLCNLTASARCLHAGSVHHFSSYASSSTASTPEENHEAVLHACQCLVCFVVYRTTAVACRVFVCQYFLLSSRSPRVTTLLMDAVNYWETRGRSHGPTGSASGWTGPTKTPLKNRRQAPYILVLVKRLPSWFAGGAQGALTAGEKKEKYAAVAVQLDAVHGHGGWMRSVSRHWAPSAETNHLVIWTPAGTGN